MRIWVRMCDCGGVTRAAEADDRPTDFDPRFYRPEPNQPKDGGADENVQNGEKIWIPSRWLDEEFQEMKADTGSGGDLWATWGI